MCSMPPAPALHPASLKKIENNYLNYDSFYFKCHMKIQVDYYLFPEAFFTKIWIKFCLIFSVISITSKEYSPLQVWQQEEKRNKNVELIQILPCMSRMNRCGTCSNTHRVRVLCVRCKRFLMCVCNAEVHTSGTVYDSMLQLDYRSLDHYLVLKGRGGFPCLSQVGLCAEQGIVFEILSLKTGCEKSNFTTNPLVRTFSQMILLSRNMLSPSASNHSSDS